jgi:hypothetical protein
MFRKKSKIQDINKHKLLQLIRCLAVIDRIATEGQLPGNHPQHGKLSRDDLVAVSTMDNEAFQKTARKNDPPLCLQLIALHHQVNENLKKFVPPSEIECLSDFKKLRKTFLAEVQTANKSPIGYYYISLFIQEIHTGYAYDKDKVAFIKAFESLNDPVKFLFEDMVRVRGQFLP